MNACLTAATIIAIIQQTSFFFWRSESNNSKWGFQMYTPPKIPTTDAMKTFDKGNILFLKTYLRIIISSYQISGGSLTKLMGARRVTARRKETTMITILLSSYYRTDGQLVSATSWTWPSITSHPSHVNQILLYW